MNYRTRHSDALRRLHERGAPVEFTRESLSYDPATDSHGAEASLKAVDGYAVEIQGDPLEYQENALTDKSPTTILFVPNSIGGTPERGDTLVWAEEAKEVKLVHLFRPAGEVIGAKVVVV